LPRIKFDDDTRALFFPSRRDRVLENGIFRTKTIAFLMHLILPLGELIELFLYRSSSPLPSDFSFRGRLFFLLGNSADIAAVRHTFASPPPLFSIMKRNYLNRSETFLLPILVLSTMLRVPSLAVLDVSVFFQHFSRT